jgi:hypothetical protein
MLDNNEYTAGTPPISNLSVKYSTSYDAHN